MTSSAGSGDRSPAPPRAMVDDLLDLQERTAMLQTMLEGSPTPPWAVERELVEGMMSSVTSALSVLNTSGGGGASSSAGGRGPGGARRKKGKAVVAGSIRRSSSSSSSSCRRRTLSPFLETVTTNTLDDGHTWRKYGQKRIQDSENPRSYYRCTHMPDQGCKARKQVQISDTNPSEYIVSYFGQHTCRDPSTIPLVIEAAISPSNCANLISFGSTTTCAHAVLPHRQEAVDPTVMLSRFVGCYSSSLPAAQERCGSEEAISGISPLGAVVAGSKGRASSTTVGSAPEYDMLEAGGIDTGSFPSSPSSLGGFMAGSFGSFGDEDLFGFDP